MSQNQLSEEEWASWLLHPVTRLLRQLLAQREEELKSQWSRGAFTAQDQFGTVIANSCAIGECKAYRGLLDLDHQQLIGEMSNEEHVVPGTPGPSNLG